MVGATQLMMGVDMVVACLFEFAAYFVVDYFIRLVGHSGIMYIGLLGYSVRFVVYASVRNPWTVLPVETLQGTLLLCLQTVLCRGGARRPRGPNQAVELS